MKAGRLIIFLFASLACKAQHRVTFQIQKYPAYQNTSSVFVAGSFNNWNPGDENFRIKENTVTVRLPAGTYEYKFTRGSWATVETAPKGGSIDNRRLAVQSDTTIYIHIADWADHFPAAPVLHTSGKNVQVIDTAFYMPQLGRSRRIWIYLPENYHQSEKKFPVLYLQDGQNVFDAATSFSGEWGVDEALDTLVPQLGATIVVAIDHGGQKRLNEYAPYEMERYGKGEGDAYLSFLVNNLKPFIEKKYRVKKCRRYQSIAGSSMGGLISFYAMLRYPKEFGAAGVFSPAFWINPGIKNLISTKGKKVKGRIYFYAGMQEGESIVPDMLAVLQAMSHHSKATMTSVIRSEGRHNEARWRMEFPGFYIWLRKSQ